MTTFSDGKIVVEAYFKRKGSSKLYRDVHFHPGSYLVSVLDVLAVSDEDAVKKAKEYLAKCIEL